MIEVKHTVNFRFPDDREDSGYAACVPRVGDEITFSGDGDYVVASVHWTAGPGMHGLYSVGACTLVLEDCEDGRQFSEWKQGNE